MIGKGKALLVHDDCMVSRVAHRLEELCGEIELCQSILNLLEDIEDGIVARELKRIYNEYCGGGDDGEV